MNSKQLFEEMKDLESRLYLYDLHKEKVKLIEKRDKLIAKVNTLKMPKKETTND